MWEQVVKGFVHFGMPVVAAYHLVMGSVFLNTAAEDGTGLEKAADVVLTPVRYLLCGKVAMRENGTYRLVQQFNYEKKWATKTTLSFLSLPIALPIGCALKAVSYLSSDVQARRKQILTDMKIPTSNRDLYVQLGLTLDGPREEVEPPQHRRRPGEEHVLPLEKALFKEIVRLFNAHDIPFWVDCGTCLGTYRYGGAIPWDEDIDLAILSPDFHNAIAALSHLDPDKYQTQDWSNRSKPATYLRIYIKENRNHIDIYHFAIDPENRLLTSILSNGDSPFMVESWKIHERRFAKPTSYDVIFPLKKAMFDGIEVTVPNQTKRYLQERYGENIEPIKIYNEVTGMYEKDLSHPYWLLPHVY